MLDIGCGAGDLSMLLADAVGETGRVVAFDRKSRAIPIARARAEAAGYRHIEFIVASDESFPAKTGFDAAVGRYILISQADPVGMIVGPRRRCATAASLRFTSRRARYTAARFRPWTSMRRRNAA